MLQATLYTHILHTDRFVFHCALACFMVTCVFVFFPFFYNLLFGSTLLFSFIKLVTSDRVSAKLINVSSIALATLYTASCIVHV